MDRITEQLNNISELSDDELTDLENQIAAEFESVESQELSQQVVEQMTALADAADAIRAEIDQRSQNKAELSRLAEEATTRVKGAKPEDTAVEGEEAVEGETEPAEASTDTSVSEPVTEPATELATEEPEAAVAVEAPAEEAVVVAEPVTAAVEVAEPEAEAVTAAVEVAETEDAPTSSEEALEGKDQEVPVTAAANESTETQIEAPADRRPRIEVSEPVVAITAGADIPGVTAGTPLDSMDAVADAMVHRMHAMRRTSGGDGEQHTVASLSVSFPEERTLRVNDPANTSKIESVISPQAITAAGGLCAPVNVRYDVFGLGTDARPVKDALAVFGADRGGIRFIAPPVIGDLSGSSSLWTVQDDIDAGTVGAPDPVKPCIRVACGAETTVTVDAIPLCLTFGNLFSRTYPEMVKRHNELGLINHARFAETRLLTRIGTLSTAVSAATVLGAARDFFVQLDKAAAGYRNRHRMDDTAPLRVIAPSWLYNMIRADLVMQIPGDGQDETFALAEAKINAWLAVRGINASWTLDGESGQVLPTQSVGALNEFPSTVIWYLFAEGTFLFLDGGTLDLGLVRDSTLNGTNDYKMFLETFEGVAKVGVESLRVTSNLKVKGWTSATVTVA